MPKAAAIYARISSDRDDDQLGVTRQLQDCRKLAAAHGWEVAEEYVDNNLSAYSNARRPAYRRMLNDITGGLRDAVIVYNADRLLRKPSELEDLIEIAATARVKDLASVTGDVDLSNEDGRLMARVLIAFAAKESDAKSRRIKRKHEELAAAGKFKGGRRPYGYDEDGRTVRPAEAAVIIEAANRVIAGESLRSICTDFDDRHILPAAAKCWTMTPLRELLISPRLVGQREHHGEIVATADWPPILSPDQGARLRAILTDPARRTNRSPRTYLLHGLLRCSRCGSRLYATPKGPTRRSYGCRSGPGFGGCNGISVAANPIELFITDLVLYRLDTPELATATAKSHRGSDDAARLSATLDSDRRQLAELSELWADQKITRAEWLHARKPIENRIDGATRKLRALDRTSALDGFVSNGAELKAQWRDLPLSRQNAIIAAVLDYAVIEPDPNPRGSRRFAHDRVKPIWRV